MRIEPTVKMSKGERLAGFIYLPFFLVLNGLIIQFAFAALGREATAIEINLVYFYLNFIAIVIIFRKFLAASLAHLIKNFGRCLKAAALGFGIYMASSITLSLLFTALVGGEVSNPNNEYVSSLYNQSDTVIAMGAVLLGPIVEEALFRGVIFSAFGRFGRFATYAMSFLFFAAIHVVSYALVSPDWTLMLNALQYLAPTVAMCYAYEKGDNIFSAILLHTAVNALAVAAMGAGVLG